VYLTYGMFEVTSR